MISSVEAEKSLDVTGVTNKSELGNFPKIGNYRAVPNIASIEVQAKASTECMVMTADARVTRSAMKSSHTLQRLKDVGRMHPQE